MDEDAQGLRRRSLAVFGNRYLADVVLAIEPSEGGDGVTVRMIAKKANMADNLVRPVALRLVEAGILVQQSPSRPRGPTFYLRAEGSAQSWSALRQLCVLLATSSTSA